MSDKNDFSKLSKLADNLANAQSMSGEIIYEDGKARGVGNASKRNLAKGTQIHKTGEDAKAYERFEAEKLGKDVSKTNPAPEGVDEGKINFVIKEFLDNDVFGVD